MSVLKLVYSVIGSILLLLFVSGGVSSQTLPPNQSPDLSTDIYHHVKRPVSGAPVPPLHYPESYRPMTRPKGLEWLQKIEGRSILWFAIQQHFFFGSFIIGAPIIAWMVELYSHLRRHRGKEDQLAEEIMQIALKFYPCTIILGVVLVMAFFAFYAGFSQYMTGLFKPVIYAYAVLFLLEGVLFYAYTLTWRSWRGRLKSCHVALGALTVASGIVIICIANAWMAFMMSPAGVDRQGRYLGNVWTLIGTPLWNPLNVHRVLASIMFSGAVIAAFSAYRVLTTHDPEEKVYYDWMGHVTILISIANLFILPFAGYWFARVIFSFRQRMGVTLMGGALSWPFVIQTMLIGLIFMMITYYLWQGMSRIPGSERYRYLAKYMMMLLFVSIIVWITPHTLPASQGELGQMGGAVHPVVGNYGTMTAKNAAINIMILVFGACLLIYQRCGKQIVVPWVGWGNAAIVALFTVAAAIVIGIGIHGATMPANLRIRLAFPQFVTVIGTLAVGAILNRQLLKGSTQIGPTQWGRLPVSGAVSLFALSVLIAMTMSLMGYIRSSARLDWHITEIMKDVSPEAAMPSIGYAMGMVCANVVIFCALAISVLRIHHASPVSCPNRAAGAPASLAKEGAKDWDVPLK